MEDPQRSKVRSEIKQLNKHPRPLLTLELWHVLFPVTHSHISFFPSWEKTFLLLLGPDCFVSMLFDSQAELEVITTLRITSVSEYNVCLIIFNPLNCEFHNLRF